MDTLTNEQIDKILSGYNRAKQNGDFTTWLSIYKDDFLTALEMAKCDCEEIEGFGDLQQRLEGLTKQYTDQFGETEISTTLWENSQGHVEIQLKITPTPPKESE